jgi:hypothetical protein
MQMPSPMTSCLSRALNRRSLAGYALLSVPLDDLPGREEILDLRPETVALNQAILHARDVRLVERLGEQLDDPGPAVRRVAIVYGASHMRAVLRELTGRRGYRVERGDWLAVFRV